jgi:GNAT superfamily N-acetyltransferase
MFCCQASRAFVPTVAPLFDAFRVSHGQPSDFALSSSYLDQRLAYGQSLLFVSKTARHQPIGFAQIYPSFSSLALKPVWILNDIFVLPEARGQGEATRLLRFIKNAAQRAMVARISLATLNENLIAQKAFEGLGWEPDQSFKHWHLSFS